MGPPEDLNNPRYRVVHGDVSKMETTVRDGVVYVARQELVED